MDECTAAYLVPGRAEDGGPLAPGDAAANSSNSVASGPRMGTAVPSRAAAASLVFASANIAQGPARRLVRPSLSISHDLPPTGYALCVVKGDAHGSCR